MVDPKLLVMLAIGALLLLNGLFAGLRFRGTEAPQLEGSEGDPLREMERASVVAAAPTADGRDA